VCDDGRMGVTVGGGAPRTRRHAVIAIVVAISLAYLTVRAGLIFACFSLPYLVAGAIGWLRKPINPTGPLLIAIGLGGALILLGATPAAAIPG